MKYIFSIIIGLTLSLCIFRPVSAQAVRGTKYTTISPFQINQKLLTKTLQQLEKTLQTGSVNELNALTMSKEKYTTYLSTFYEPNKAPAVAAMYAQLTNTLKNELIAYNKQVNQVKLIYSTCRIGVNQNMKFIQPAIQLILNDKQIIPIKLQLIEFDNKYWLFSIDE